MTSIHHNNGKPWTSADKARLVEQYRQGATIEQLSEQFGRKPSSIERRLVDAGLLTDTHGWTTNEPSTSPPTKPATPTHVETASLLVGFLQAYKSVYGEEYWSARNCLRGRSNARVIAAFDRLCEFLKQHLSPRDCERLGASWEGYLQYALAADKNWKTSARIQSLINTARMREYKNQAASKALVARCDASPLPDYAKILGAENARWLGLV